jgi:hypothetical protein
MYLNIYNMLYPLNFVAIVFLEYAGELRIIALRRRVVKYNTHTTHTLSSTNNAHLAR